MGSIVSGAKNPAFLLTISGTLRMLKPETIVWIKQQNENRLLWNDHDSPEQLAKMILDESNELETQLQESFITDDITALAAEIGDVMYLTARYRLHSGDLPLRLKACEFRALEICEMTGLNPNDCTMMKLDRNAKKYPDHTMSNGRTYEQAVVVCKEGWQAMGGDVAWSHAYLDHFAHVEEDENA